MHEAGRRTTEPPDEHLAERVQRGDRAALEQLVARYLRPIHAVIASYLRERADVEDAVQDAFMRALERIGGYQSSRPFAPWLYQVARNVARDRLTAHARTHTEPLPPVGPETAAPGPDTLAERGEIRELVERAIGDLPEQQRVAFRLHDVDGYSTTEIARIMEVAEGTVRSHVHHARRALRKALAGMLRDANERDTTS
ncbi:MAG TPA: RNA polymerase sigma factor [Longimicrobiales bacterium]|nr:RNA polymerase sigma factor [Longimicrobiales bacterium]